MKKLILFISFISLVFSANALNSTHIMRTFKSPVYTDEQVLTAIQQEFSVPEGLELQPFRDEIDDLGIRHISYRQIYNGIVIENAVVLVHCRAGKVTSINGSLMQSTPANVHNNLSVNRAIKRVKQAASQSEAAELLLVEFNDEYRYAYKVESPEEAKTYYVDSESGEILKVIPYFQSISVTGTGYTLYSGWQQMVCEENNGIYSLEDRTRNIITLDASGISYSFMDLMDMMPDSLANIYDAALDNEDIDLASRLFGSFCYSMAISNSPQITNDENSWYISALSSVTFTSANSSWWYDVWDQKPDLYIKVYNHNGLCVYTSATKTDVTFPVTFNIPDPIILTAAGYTIKVYDEDVTSDAYGGSITISNATRGTYTWSSSSTTSGSFVISPLPSGHFDVHWGMQKTYDFYSNVLNRNSYDNQGATIYNLVYPPQSQLFPTMPNNAAALYKVSPNLMYYGAGTPGMLNPVVSLDVMSHEFTHLVTGNNGNGGLEYVSESGALNESFSDIMAMGVVYTTTGSCPWTIGDQLWADESVKPNVVRSFANPHLYNQPSIYLYDPYWSTLSPDQDSTMLVVHTNSGVQNKWFYILAHGEGSIAGIGIPKGIQIAYRNLIYYLSPNANHYDARRGSIQAAMDLYGANSIEVQTVKDAWDAVGVYDYSLQPGKYVIYAESTGEEQAWFISSNLTTTSTKRFVADTIANRAQYFYVNADPAFVWNITQNADGTYVFESNGKYMSWTSGNSGAMSTTPKNLDVTFDPDSYGYVVSFKASETETRTLSYNTANGSQYFAFYGNTNQNHILYFVEAFEVDTTVVRAKMPSNWGNTIRAWVWYDGEDGEWATPTLEDGWYVYRGLGEYNIIFVNGTTWNGDNNQTMDIAVHGDMCIMIGSNTSGKRTFGQIECDPEPFVPDCKTLPFSESFSSNQGDFTIENVALDGLGYVWTFASGYGMKASAYVSSVNHPTESWLISPCLELPEDATINLTFDHVYRYTTTPTTDLNLLVSENYIDGAPSSATWTPVAIPTYSSGSNWTFVNAGNIDLSAYAGKNVTLAFRYKSSSSAAATWEIKNVSVTSSGISTGLDAALDSHNATKCIIDGHLFILRDGHKFTATGTMVE